MKRDADWSPSKSPVTSISFNGRPAMYDGKNSTLARIVVRWGMILLGSLSKADMTGIYKSSPTKRRVSKAGHRLSASRNRGDDGEAEHNVKCLSCVITGFEARISISCMEDWKVVAVIVRVVTGEMNGDHQEPLTLAPSRNASSTTPHWAVGR